MTNLHDFIHSRFFAILIWLIIGIYGVVLYAISPVLSVIDWLSVLAEGAVAIMPAVGLFIITRVDDKKIFSLLMIGLTLLCIALVTDTLDEFVDVPVFVTHLCEGLFQVLGFMILVLGIHQVLERNNEMMNDLHDLADTDPLTEIGNRRYFRRGLELEFKRLHRTPGSLALIIFDLDFFKRINDSYGHDVGDLVLKAVASKIKENLRETDMFARFGGEEFVIASINIDLEQAFILADKLLFAINELKVDKVEGVRASFGISCYRDSDSIDTLIKRADDALYESKLSGRNRISTHEPMLTANQIHQAS